MKREEIISGLQMTMDLIQFDPGTGNVRPVYELNDLDKTTYLACKAAIEVLKAQPNLQQSCNQLATDTIYRQDAVDVVKRLMGDYELSRTVQTGLHILPSAQPEQRYTEEELRVFAHGISLSLLSKRSAQHWSYDEDTATEIKFLERLYEKVVADMRGEQDESDRR